LSTHNPYAPKKRNTEVKPETTSVEAANEETSYEVPEGSITKIMKWVDGDSDRAKAAYEVEQAEEKPRTSLLGQLEELF
jgi:hypothetical protein